MYPCLSCSAASRSRVLRRGRHSFVPGFPSLLAAMSALLLAAVLCSSATAFVPPSSLPWALGVALGFMVAVVGGRAQSAMAADIEDGASVFGGNCAACHAGGNNSVQAEKKLKKEALTQYGMYDIEKN